RGLSLEGNSLSVDGSPAEALKSYQQSEESFQRLVREHSNNHAYLNGLAASTSGVGNSLRRLGRAADGDVALKRTMALYEQLTQAEPGNALYQNAFAQSCYLFGAGLNSSRSEETLVYFRKARGIWERALTEHPNSLFLQNNLGFIHDGIA